MVLTGALTVPAWNAEGARVRILLINQYAGSPNLGMEHRPHWMASEWQKLGHEVLIVAGDYSHLRRTQPPVGRSNVEGVHFLTVATPQYGDNGPRRFMNILAFRTQLQRSSKTLGGWRPDAVIASSTHPMDIRPGLRLARRSGAIFVHEVHDLWPLTPKLLGSMSDRHPMIMWMQREEDLSCREADLVVSMLPETLPYLLSRGLDPARWTYVSNGVPPEAVMQGDESPAQDGVFRVGYFGGHSVSNDLGTLIRAARLLKDKSLEFHLTGSGPLKAELELQAKDLEKVHFHSPVAPGEARQQMRVMDALYMAVQPSPLYEHGIGLNKMFDYMAAGRPIIQAIEAPSSPAEQAGCALPCKPGDPEDVARAILGLTRLPRDQRAIMGGAGRDYVLGHATYPRLAEAFATAMEIRRSQSRTSSTEG